MSLFNKKNINNQIFYQFIQDIYNHIRIASAISIIRTKPQDLSLKEYILIIQTRIKNKSHFMNNISNQLFSNQQEALTQIEQFILPQNSIFNKSIDIFNDETSEKEKEELIIHENNSQFIQSLLQIKSILNNSNSQEHKSFNHENNLSFLRYKLHLSDTDDILIRSVHQLCDYLFDALTGNNSYQIITNWKGSLFENALKLLLELLTTFADNFHLFNISFDLIKKLILYIESRSGMSKNVILEKQCNIIFEISVHKQMCYKTIDYLIKKICDICKYLTQTNNRNLTLIDTIEKSFYIFNLTEKLITIYVTRPLQFRDLRSQTTSNQSTMNSVTQLWQASWHHLPSTSAAINNSPKPLEIDENEFLIWKSKLETEVVQLMDQYPLHFFILWNCINSLNKIESIQSSIS